MPLDVPSNRIRFIVENPDVESGPFTIWLKPVGSKIYDRYFVRVNGGPWMYQGINGNVFPGSMWRKKLRVNLQKGINYIDFSYERSLVLDKILVTNYEGFTPRYLGGAGEDCELTPPPMATDQNTFWLEGECAEVGENWSKTSDPAASGGQAVVVSGRNAMEAPPADVPANLIRFTVEQADSGSYNLFARIKAPSGYDYSYYVRANGGSGLNGPLASARGVALSGTRSPRHFPCTRARTPWTLPTAKTGPFSIRFT